MEQEVRVFPSLMGVDCGVKGVFKDYDNGFTHIHDWSNEVREGNLTSSLPLPPIQGISPRVC